MKLKRSTTVLALTLVLVLLAAPLTYAWLSYSLTQSVGMTAYVHKAYFESGDGSAESPFEIKTPVQLYYFAWLQNLGYFNNVNGKTGVTSSFPTYFYLSSDLDMSGFTLPPAGNTTYPFIGNFSGKDQSNVTHTISNLTIKSSATVTDLTDVPNEGNNMAATDPQILGFFGVIGDYNGAGTYSSYSPSVHDLTLCDIVIQSISPDDDKTLCGIVAGYSNGAMSNISVTRSGAGDIITINTGLSALGSPLTNYSDYGVVGYCTPAYLVTVSNSEATVYEPLLITDYTGGEGYGSGGEIDHGHWGGSINIQALNVRLYTLLNKDLDSGALNGTSSNDAYINANLISAILTGKGVQTKYHHYYADDYNRLTCYQYILYDRSYAEASSTSVWNNSKQYLRTDPRTAPIVYRFESVSPVYNYSNTNVGTNSSRNIRIPVPVTILPIMVDEGNNFHTLSENTGYIVGGMSGSGAYGGQTTVRTASYSMTYIGNAISSSGTSSATYNPSSLEILTNSSSTYSSSNFARINDSSSTFTYDEVTISTNNGNSNVASVLSGYGKTVESNALKKYENSRVQLDSVLSGATYVHGLHFTGSAISASSFVNLDTAYINDQVLTDYELPTSSIDFNLKENGYINFFAGSYFNEIGTACDSFFSLHVVERYQQGDSIPGGKKVGDIKGIYEISKIYENSDTATKTQYPHVYQYTTGGYSIGTADTNKLEFDMRFLWNAAPVTNALYYFEVPVNHGEYAMGSVNTANQTTASNTKGTYLLYLDIGTSDAELEPINGTKTVEYLTTTTSKYTYPSGVSLQLTSGQVDDPITTANSSTNISTIRTPTYGYTEWKWQKEVFVGTINGVDSTVKIAKITRTDYNSAGTQTAQSEESYQWDSTANSGSGGWAAYTTDVEFLDLSAVTSYLTEAAKYTYSGAPNGTASAPYSSSIFESDTSSVTWSTTPATGKLYTMASGTYSVTLPTSASLHKLFGANASNTGSIVLITKTE